MTASPRRSRSLGAAGGDDSEPADIDEAGLRGVDSSIWIGMLAPAGTPREIVDVLSKAVNEALKSDDVVGQMQLQGMEPLGGTPGVVGSPHQG